MVDWARHIKNFISLRWGQILQDFISWRHFNHDAEIKDLSYNEDLETFRLDIKTIKMKEMDPHALPITGDKYGGFRTDLEPPFRAEKREEIDEDGNKREYLNPSAISYNLYMVNNDINRACTADMRRFTITPKSAVILIAVALGILGVWYFMGA